LAKPLLELVMNLPIHLPMRNHMNHTPTPFGEALVDARDAAHQFNLPVRWLTQPKERRKHGIPHYQVGTLIRFKPSELAVWAEVRGSLEHA
jgi:hypothetical protein